MKRLLNLYRAFFALVVISILLVFGYYKYQISKMSDDNTAITVQIESGANSTTIAATLKEQGLIRKETFLKLYLKLNNITNLQAGTYELNQTMNMEQIINIISNGEAVYPDSFSITIKEGENIRDIVKLLEENTIHSEEELYAKLDEESYLDQLIEDYWFITDDIKNEEIYYSLEGYLFPDTYTLYSDEMPIEEIYKMFLDNMKSKLDDYKEDIEESDLTIHELLTLASIVELEGSAAENRAKIADIFIRRLKAGDSLGSDVTTYYAEQKDITESLYLSELNEANAYNTRNGNLPGQLPVGPICSPGIESIEGTINPIENNYYYFIADKYKNIYFMSTYQEHLSKVSELKANGLWIE